MKREYDEFEQLVAEIVKADMQSNLWVRITSKDGTPTIRVGDKVTRMLCGSLPMPLIVTAIDDQFIFCGDWKFDKLTGAEIDEELGWDNNGTGSFLQEFSS